MNNSLACRELLPEPEVRKASCAVVAHPSAVRRWWWWMGDDVSGAFMAQRLSSLHKDKVPLIAVFTKWEVQGLHSAIMDWETWLQLIKLPKPYQREEFRYLSSVRMKLRKYMSKPSQFPTSQGTCCYAGKCSYSHDLSSYYYFESRKFSFLSVEWFSFNK